MKGTKVREYTKNGNLVSVFELSGTPAEISAYESAQGENFRKSDSGKPLFFATKQAQDWVEGETVNIVHTEQYGYIIDGSANRKINQMIEKHAGTPLGDALVNKLAEDMLAKAQGGARRSTSVAPASEEDSAE